MFCFKPLDNYALTRLFILIYEVHTANVNTIMDGRHVPDTVTCKQAMMHCCYCLYVLRCLQTKGSAMTCGCVYILLSVVLIVETRSGYRKQVQIPGRMTSLICSLINSLFNVL